MNDYVKCDHIATDRLLTELERRAEDNPGQWTQVQIDRLGRLVRMLDPPPEVLR